MVRVPFRLPFVSLTLHTPPTRLWLTSLRMVRVPFCLPLVFLTLSTSRSYFHRSACSCTDSGVVRHVRHTVFLLSPSRSIRPAVTPTTLRMVYSPSCLPHTQYATKQDVANDIEDGVFSLLSPSHSIRHQTGCGKRH